MQCRHCGFGNGEDDHRCLRCGRRLKGTVIAAPAGYSGANALAVAPAVLNDTLNDTLGDTLSSVLTGTLSDGTPEPGTAQTALFGSPSPNVIPFDRHQRTVRNAALAKPATPNAPQRPQFTQRTAAPRRPAKPPAEQATLDFIPAAPARNRKLKTDVDAQIFCDQPVATPTHRCVASAVDAAVIVIGFGIVTVIFQALGGRFGSGRNFWIGMAATFAVVSMFYGLIWAIAGRETAGMRFTDLRLITFDGFPVDTRSRALRFFATWLSFGSGGLGVLWALADEENLTWHDHISKTFPTIREEPRTFVRQRR